VLIYCLSDSSYRRNDRLFVIFRLDLKIQWSIHESRYVVFQRFLDSRLHGNDKYSRIYLHIWKYAYNEYTYFLKIFYGNHKICTYFFLWFFHYSCLRLYLAWLCDESIYHQRVWRFDRCTAWWMNKNQYLCRTSCMGKYCPSSSHICCTICKNSDGGTSLWSPLLRTALCNVWSHKPYISQKLFCYFYDCRYLLGSVPL
jgi:hypothetical protein